MTDAWTLLAVYGPRSTDLLNRLVIIDFDPSLNTEPLFMVTRAHNAKVQIINPKNSMGYLVACDRSFGQDLFDSCFHIPDFLKIRLSGEVDFREWSKGVNHHP